MLQRAVRAVMGQFGNPHGRAAPYVAAFLNVVNAPMNRAAVRAATAGNPQSVLDVGFGGGPALARLLRRGVPHVTGVDISDEMIERARGRFGAAVTLVKAPVEALPFEPGSFDAVVSVNSVHFWPDRVAALREVRRVLRPGGRVALGFDPGPTRIFTSFPTRDDLVADVEAAGFVDVAVPRSTPTGVLVVGTTPGPATAS